MQWPNNNSARWSHRTGISHCAKRTNIVHLTTSTTTKIILLIFDKNSSWLYYISLLLDNLKQSQDQQLLETTERVLVRKEINAPTNEVTSHSSEAKKLSLPNVSDQIYFNLKFHSITTLNYHLQMLRSRFEDSKQPTNDSQNLRSPRASTTKRRLVLLRTPSSTLALV